MKQLIIKGKPTHGYQLDLRDTQDKHLYFEDVTERFCGRVTASKVHPATPEEVAAAEALRVEGKCPTTSWSTKLAGWLYDTRSCAPCGKGLGTV